MHDHQSDDMLLSMFQKLGVDPKKSRELNFYFIFASQDDAACAVESIKQRDMVAEISHIKPPFWKRLFVRSKWLVSTTAHMAMDESKLKQLTTVFQKIASDCNGNYDGWEANVMGEQLDVSQLQ